MRAKSGHARSKVRVPHRSGHPGAHRTAKLDRRGADTTGSAVHQEPFTWRKPGLCEQRIVWVVKVSGSPPADSQSSLAGTGISSRS